MRFLLSKIEREYVKGKKELKPSYRYNIRSKIRKKTRQAMKDLTLVFEKWDATELRFNEKDYQNLAIPLLRAIQYVELRERFFEHIRNSYIALALEGAGKRYDYKRLATNEQYRQRMIDWLQKKGLEFWKPPSTEEQKRRWEKLRDMMREVKAEAE